MKGNNIIVISLGGSLVVPEGIDADFLKSFSNLIKELTERRRFFIITGGGATARTYQDGLQRIKEATSSELDWMGIYATHLNGELLRLALGEYAYEKLTTDTDLFLSSDKPIFVGGGTKPGWTSDNSAITVAKNIGAKRMINLSNIDFIYEEDPKKNPQAKKIEKITWTNFRKLIPSKHEPGLNSPFDPVAAQIAHENEIEVAVLNGRNMTNLTKCLNGEEFQGTLISSNLPIS